MTDALEIAGVVVLVPGLLATLGGCAGVLLLRDPYARLHSASLVGFCGPLAVIAGALPTFLAEPGAPLRLGLLLVAAVLAAGAGTHALGRALRLRGVAGEPRS